jgi:hypothetical protein
VSEDESFLRAGEDRFVPRIPTIIPLRPGSRLPRVPIGDEELRDVLIERIPTEIPQPPQVIEPEELIPFISPTIPGHLDIEVSNRIQRIALSDTRIRGLLTEGKYATIGPTLSAPKGEESSPTLKQIFYNYSDNNVIETTINLEQESVIAVEQLKYQPPPTQEELDKAVARAVIDDRISEQIKKEKLEGTGILIIPRETDERANHRLIDVRFGKPDSRLPVLQALVDLSTDEVVKAGPIE